MEGASRRALAETRARLDALIAAPGVDATRVSADLDAVAGLVRAELPLRRALADPGVEAASRTGLIDRLTAGRVDAVTGEVLRTAVALRWSRPLDLLAGLVELSAEALLAQAQRDGALDDVEDELFRFARIVGQAPALSLAFTDPALPLERKDALVERLLAGKASPVTILLARRSLAEADGGDLERRLDALARLAAARRDRVVAVVHTARPLDAGQIERLRASIGRYFGREIQLQVDVDPTLVGGVVVRVGDEVVDGSVVRRLADARRRLLRQ